MNERIKELALHAGFAYEPNKDQLWVDGPTEIMISPGLEKFAELIVKETLNKIQSVGHKSSNDIPFEITDLFVSSVKQHFGVEE